MCVRVCVCVCVCVRVRVRVRGLEATIPLGISFVFAEDELLPLLGVVCMGVGGGAYGVGAW